MKPFQYAATGITRAAARLTAVSMMPAAILTAIQPAFAQSATQLPTQQPVQQNAPASMPVSVSVPQDENEAVGLPSLTPINRPAGVAHSNVEINAPRVPSFYEKSGNGTSITEYRDRGRPIEIQVHSSFGTHYQMSAPLDTSPQVYESNKPPTRLPSVQLKY